MIKSRFVYDEEVYQNLFMTCFKDVESKGYRDFLLFADRQNDRYSINQLPELLAFVEREVEWLIGYNSKEYDDVLLLYLLQHKRRLLRAHPSVICRELKELSDRLISAQHLGGRDPLVYQTAKADKPWLMLDLMQQFNPIDRVSLKQLAVVLRWPKVQDLPLPASHVVRREEIPLLTAYNHNDVDITEHVMEYLGEEINLKIAYTRKYHTNIINSSRSQIGKRIICDYYEQRTGVPYEVFSRERTHYDRLSLRDCISPRIRFETPEYLRLVERIEGCTIDPNVKGKDRGVVAEETVRIEYDAYGPLPLKKKRKEAPMFEQQVRSKYLMHTMMLGGLHSNNPAEILEENDRYMYIDLDVASFYPWIIIRDRLHPRHLDPVIVEIYEEMIVRERMRIKKQDPTLAEMLKIAANAYFGQTKAEGSPFWDPRMTTFVCISGQLYLMMLMEALERYTRCVVVYSNTDGLTVRVPRSEVHKFYGLCTRWQRYLGFELEFVEYRRMIMRDVNNYLMFGNTDNPKKRIKAKGAYVYMPERTELKEMAKGYIYPIIPKAVQEYYDKGIPVGDTILKEQSIYEFMRSERTSQAKFEVLLRSRTEQTLQKTNRWVVTRGHALEGQIVKVSRATGQVKEMQKGRLVTLLNDVPEGLSVKDYALDYDFYIQEAQRLCDLTKPLEKDHHHPAYCQAKLQLL